MSIDRKFGLFLFFITMIRLAWAAGLQLIPDEAYYWVWSQNIDWSYFDHAPLVAWLIRFFSMVGFSGIWPVRLVAVFSSAGASIYAYLLAKEMFDRPIAWRFVTILNFTLVMFAGSMITTPDSPMFFFLAGAMYWFWLAVKTDTARDWLLWGGFMGLAMLSKYVAVLLFPPLLIFLLTGEERRRLLLSWRPWTAFGLALALFSPVIFWNATNNWISFRFQLSHGLGGEFPHWRYFTEFLSSQSAMPGPILFVMVWVWLFHTVRTWKKQKPRLHYLWWITVFILLFFSYSALQKRVEPNWPAFAWVPGILLVTWFAWRTKKAWVHRFWRFNWYLLVTVNLAIMIHVYAPLVIVDAEPTHQLFGWKEAGQRVAELAEENPGFIPAANRYQYASEMRFYSGLEVRCLPIDGRVSQYDLWQIDEPLAGRNYLFIDHRKNMKSVVRDAFQRIEFVEKIPFERNGQELEKHFIKVYRAWGLKPDRLPSLIPEPASASQGEL